MAETLANGRIIGPVTPSTESDSSAFILLSTTPSSYPNVTLARPRFLPVLGIAALLDLACTAVYLFWVVQSNARVNGTFVWGVLRPLVVLFVITSSKVRERGWVALGQVGVTILVALYHFNEIVQSRSLFTPVKSLPSTALASSSSNLSKTTEPLIRDQIYLPTRLSPMSQYLVISLAFSVLHWILFATFVGIRRRQNPFARGSGLRSAHWGEQRWEGHEETLGAASPSLYAEPDEEDEDFDEEEDDDEGSSSEDEDEIIDIPKSGELRSRTSRISLHREDSANSRASDRERRQSVGQGIGASTRYGSINSLAGI